jgi:hypothetical protein
MNMYYEVFSTERGWACQCADHRFRGVKSMQSPIFKRAQIFHNFVRPRMALEGKTPAEVAGIKVEGSDKWKTLIQNACLNQSLENEE